MKSNSSKNKDKRAVSQEKKVKDNRIIECRKGKQKEDGKSQSKQGSQGQSQRSKSVKSSTNNLKAKKNPEEKVIYDSLPKPSRGKQKRPESIASSSKTVTNSQKSLEKLPKSQKEVFTELNKNLPSLPTPKATSLHLRAMWQKQGCQKTQVQSVPSQKDFSSTYQMAQSQNIDALPRVESQVISQQHWEAYQTLLAKNSELKKHIEEMEAIEARTSREGAGRQDKLKEENELQKEQYNGQIGRLRLEQQQIRQVYASLQSVLNDRTGEVTNLKNECRALKDKANESFQRETSLMKERAQATTKIKNLQRSIDESEIRLAKMGAQRDGWRRKFMRSQDCCSKAKQEAQAVLEIVREMSQLPENP